MNISHASKRPQGAKSQTLEKIKKMQKTLDFCNFFEGPGLGALGPFGRMVNVNWVILGFRPQKCTQYFVGTRVSDFRHLPTKAHFCKLSANFF